MTTPRDPPLPASEQRRSSLRLGGCLALFGYLVGGVLAFTGLVANYPVVLILGLDLFAAALIGTNARGLRARFLPRRRQMVVTAVVLGIIAVASIPLLNAGAPPRPIPTATPVVLAAATFTPIPVTLIATSAATFAAVPPTVTQPLAPALTAPTAGPDPEILLARLDEAWQKGDWPTTVTVLDALETTDPSAADFTDKRYVAQYSWGKSLLEQGDKAGAASHFAQAVQIDSNRGEAPEELLALTPTPTPIPSTATPVLPTATPVPTPGPKPISLSGRGQTATDPVTPPASLSIVMLTHNGQANFIVRAVGNGSQDISLVNAIGPYRGQRPLAGNKPVAFDIRADGAWTIRIDPIQTGGSPAFQGTGDAVSPLFTPPSNGPWEISHDGRANFIVHLYCRDGDTSVQNEIGPVQGSRLLRFGQAPCFWEVRADGKWSLTPR